MTKFRLQGKFFMLTYKEHHQKQSFKWMEGKKNTHKLCWETGKTGYKHTHLIIHFKDKFHTRKVNFFDIGNVHPNIKQIRTRAHWLNCVKYTEKDEIDGVKSDTLTGNEYEYMGDLKDLIQAKNSWQEVMNDSYISNRIMKFMKWARETYDAKPLPNFSEDVTLRKWQQEEVDLLEEQNKRTVRWVWDKDGNKGKSVLTDWLIDEKNAFFCEGGQYKDIAYAYQNQEYVVFDLPRTNEDFVPYKAIESLKNGRMFSSKYTSCMKRFKPAKVIIFANFPPNEAKLSKDRWSIKCLDTLAPQVLNIKRDLTKSGVIVEDIPRTQRQFDLEKKINDFSKSNIPLSLGSDVLYNMKTKHLRKKIMDIL